MSNLILPGGSLTHPIGQEPIQIAWTQDDVPRALVEDLEMNEHLFPKYVNAVKRAVMRSLNHPETKPHVLTENTLKERVQMCHRALLAMREEQGLTLHRCFDQLSEKFLRELLEGRRVEDLAEKERRLADDLGDGVTGDSWSRTAERHLHTVGKEHGDVAPKADVRKLAAEGDDED